MNMTRRQETSGNTKPTNLVTNLSGQSSAKKASLPLKMALQTPLTDLLGIKHPIMLAGMNGVSHSDLAAAVSNAGQEATTVIAAVGSVFTSS